jgi:hypothetical protein
MRVRAGRKGGRLRDGANRWPEFRGTGALRDFAGQLDFAGRVQQHGAVDGGREVVGGDR